MDNYCQSLINSINDMNCTIDAKNARIYEIDSLLKETTEELTEEHKEELNTELETLVEDISDIRKDIGALQEIIDIICIQEDSYDNNWNDSGYNDY